MKIIAIVLELLLLTGSLVAQRGEQGILAHKVSGGGGTSLVQCAIAPVNVNTSYTVSITPTNGNTLVAAIGAGSSGGTIGSVVSVKDNNNNSFTADNSGQILPGGNFGLEFFHLSSVSGVTSVTVIFSASSYSAPIVCELSGSAPKDVMDNTGNIITGTTWATTAITTSNAVDIVFGLAANWDGNTLACTSPWVSAQGENNLSYVSIILCYQIVSSTGTYTPAGTDVQGNYPTATITASYK